MDSCWLLSVGDCVGLSVSCCLWFDCCCLSGDARCSVFVVGGGW